MDVNEALEVTEIEYAWASNHISNRRIRFPIKKQSSSARTVNAVVSGFASESGFVPAA